MALKTKYNVTNPNAQAAGERQEVVFVKIPNGKEADVSCFLPLEPQIYECWEIYNPKGKITTRYDEPPPEFKAGTPNQSHVQYYSAVLITPAGAQGAVLPIKNWLVDSGTFDNIVGACANKNPNAPGVIVRLGRNENNYGTLSVYIKDCVPATEAMGEFNNLLPDIDALFKAMNKKKEKTSVEGE